MDMILLFDTLSYIILCKNLIQIIILYDDFIIHFFQYTTMKYKPYPKTIAPYDISYD